MIVAWKSKQIAIFYIEKYLQYDLWNEKSLVIDQNLALLMTDIYLHYELLRIKIDFLHILSA